jgi:hypothetical protein
MNTFENFGIFNNSSWDYEGSPSGFPNIPTSSETEGVPQPDISLFSYDNDFWSDIFNNFCNVNGLHEPSISSSPPSPASCDGIEITEMVNSMADIDDVFPFTTVAKQPPTSYVPNDEAEAPSLPSPPSSDGQSTRLTASPAQPLASPPHPVPRRRGPGRPSKAQLAARGLESKNLSSRSKVTLRREFHNDSATRSRAKFNGALDELWKEIPEEHRSQVSGFDKARQVSRAEKVEIIISFIRKLRRQVEKY